MTAPVPRRRRRPVVNRPPEPSSDESIVVDAGPAGTMDLPSGIDSDALQAAWFDHCTEHEAARERKEMKDRGDRVATRVAKETRMRKAYELRMSARLTYRAIAEQLGISISMAYQDVAAFGTASVPISEKETARREMIEMYERMLRELIIGMSEVGGAAKLPFIDRVVQVQQRLDKAHGVDQPASQVDPADLGTVDDIDAAANQLVAEMEFLARNNLIEHLVDDPQQ